MKNKTVIFLLIILSLAGAFYWFQIRPAEIRKKCSDPAKALSVITNRSGKGQTEAEVKETILESGKGIPSSLQENLYRHCLVIHGLKTENLY